MSPNVRVTRRTQQKAATRRQLLSAARERFTSDGVAATGVGDVSRAAGVAHGTFYVHFANKEAVVRELIADLNSELARRVASAFARPTSAPLSRLVRRVGAVFLDYWAEERELIACLADHMVANLSLAELRDGINPPMAGLLEGGLRELAAQRRLGSAPIDLLAHALLAMWLRVGLRYLFADGASRKVTLDLLVTLTTSAIDAALPPEEDPDAPVS